MKWKTKALLGFLMGPALAGSIPRATVVTYPAPAGEKLSEDYTVEADGKPVSVYAARTLDEPFAGKQWNFGGPYSFASFDFEGRVRVRVTAKKPLGRVVVRPESFGLKPAVQGDTLTLDLDRPRKVSIEPDGKNGPLLLFANPLETSRPKEGAPDVIWFGPGIHKPERLKVGSGQTLYIAGGAVVKGGVQVTGKNVRVLGRGILCGNDWPWTRGPGNLIGLQDASDVRIDGVILRGCWGWTLVPRNCDRVTITNVKICNGRVQNDDGINPCNSRNVTVRDCFIRSDDDCLALKGLRLEGENNVEDILVEDCTLWCDRARIVLMGHESRAKYMRRIVFRNIDIIHYAMTPFLLEPGEEMVLEDVRFENIRLNGEGQNDFIALRPVVNQYMKNKVPGHIRNVRFEDVSITGAPGAYRIRVQGADEAHQVRGVVFRKVTRRGEAVAASSANVLVGSFAGDVQFGP
jgi:hypothetical protein